LKDLKANSNPDIKVFLIGNKIDLEESRLVTKEQALKFKEDFELDLFMETSAKTGFNTQELFVQAAKVLYDDYMKYKQKSKTPTTERIKIEQPKVVAQEPKGGCCHK
jgi:GTPase SAR1 family protein